ncbi:unnamed protein product [Leptidea sinapis]|uniref:Uncharacterized protein n=1 Tax=Leptidea sinapis TaxID=189913 RepID=A0A5E4Q048_9NEOP|nr:unnamed protein product [Leptidea sinapis]
MRWMICWQVLVALHSLPPTNGQTPSPTLCNDDACRCDSFTRVICKCSQSSVEVTLRPNGAFRVPSMATAITIDGCAKVQFLPETVGNLTQLRTVQLKNIDYIVISERGLAWSPFSRHSDMEPGIRITIENSTVDEISSHAIQGRVNDIIISDSRINNLRPFAFSSLTGLKNVELNNNEFKNIDIQTFKKFSVSNFVVRGGKIDTMPSRFLSDVEITNLFRLDSVNINYLSSLTFLVSSPKRILVENNLIGTLEGDGFHVISTGPITFRNNSISNLRKGALLGFTVDAEVLSTMGKQELLIDNNTITNLSPASLIYNMSSLTLRIDGMNLNTTCSCEIADEWREIYEHGAIINCWYDLEGHFISIPTYVTIRCGSFKNNYWIFIVIAVVVVVLIVAIVLYFALRHENEKKKKLQIVLPDGKTYRETEFHIVVERAELLTTEL